MCTSAASRAEAPAAPALESARARPRAWQPAMAELDRRRRICPAPPHFAPTAATWDRGGRGPSPRSSFAKPTRDQTSPSSTSTTLLERAKGHEPDRETGSLSSTGRTYTGSVASRASRPAMRPTWFKKFRAVWQSIDDFRRERPGDSFARGCSLSPRTKSTTISASKPGILRRPWAGRICTPKFTHRQILPGKAHGQKSSSPKRG